MATATARRRTRQPRMPIEVRREQVLDAALRLIGAHGYGAASMEAIAREAELAKPVVYNAYPGRDALLRALLGREEARAFAALAEAMPAQPADGDAQEMLLFWLGSLARAISEHPDPWRLMLIPPDETPGVVREHVQAGRTLALEQVRALISALLARQPKLTRLDRELAAQSLLATAEHAARLLIAEPAEYTPERMVDFAALLLKSF